jgi:phage terminase Nu1 subunit (DNA packaging protein)
MSSIAIDTYKTIQKLQSKGLSLEQEGRAGLKASWSPRLILNWIGEPTNDI